MDTFSYGSAMPWFFDPAYLMKMVEVSVSAVAVSAIAGLVYAALFHLLSNRNSHRSIHNITCREGQYDEA